MWNTDFAEMLIIIRGTLTDLIHIHFEGYSLL
jgi:hypothetical protein